MKVTIRDRVAGEKLAHAVPPAYREELLKGTRPDGRYSVLLFAHAPRDVVPSPPVRKALRRLHAPAADGIIAVGTVFTTEALELLQQAGARVVAYRKAKWTDESARQRQLKPAAIGSAAEDVRSPGPSGTEEPSQPPG